MITTFVFLIVLITCLSSFSQQITISDIEPLNIRSDANNSTVFIGLSTTATNGGGANTFVGFQAGQRTTSGTENTFVGYQAGFNSLGGSNLFLGAYAGYSSTNSTASFNTFIGQRTGYNNTSGLANIFLGSNAGYSNQSGNYNTFIGNSAGQQSQLGSFNTFIGNGAGYNANNTNYNLFIGAQAGFYTTTGNYNVMLGQDAGLSNKSGNNNTFIGWQANSAGANAANLTNAVAIGANAQVAISNALVLGNNANVGIGTSAPATKLEITQGTTGNSGLRFTNLTSSSTATVLNQTKFLTVNAQGDVVLGSLNSSARIGTDQSGDVWQANGENIQNTNAGGVIIGTDVGKTPIGYRLFVADGILTEKVKVAVKSTSDWSDHVFDLSYRLRNLQEVEAFIIKEKHLPGIPSAKEVVEEGVNVGKMQAKLLEKVEELTLYAIQVEKISRKQQQEIEELKRLIKQLLQQKHSLLPE